MAILVGASLRIGLLLDWNNSMTMCRVVVTSEWRSQDTFEFDSQEEAHDFVRAVNKGGQSGLEKIVNAGDVDSANAELINYDAHIEQG